MQVTDIQNIEIRSKLKDSICLQTESNHRCNYDVATVFDSDGTIIHKYCGQNTKNIQVSMAYSI